MEQVLSNTVNPYPWIDSNNPLKAGLTLGLIGAASGLGFAGINRAIKLQTGNKTPVHVLRPVLIGAALGSALGLSQGISLKGNQIASTPTNFTDLENMMDQYGGYKMSSTKYAGLNLIVEKSAMDKQAILPLAFLAPLAMKGLMFATMGMGAYGAVDNARKGNWLGAAGNAVMALPGIGWLGKGLKGLQMAGRLGQAGKLMEPAVAAAGKWTPKFYTAGKQQLANWGSGVYNALGGTKPVQALAGNAGVGRFANAAGRVGDWSSGILPQGAGIGISMMGGGMGGQPQRVPPMRAQSPSPFAGLQSIVGSLTAPQPMPQFQIPGGVV